MFSRGACASRGVCPGHGDGHDRSVREQSYDGRFGVSYLHIFVDERGRKAKWFATGKCLDKGLYEIKATVKKHDVYQDRKETLLTRCSVVREIAAPAA